MNFYSLSKVVEQIREQDAEYVIGLKRNQKNLYEQVYTEIERQKVDLPHSESRDLGHGRGELRKVYVCETLDFVDERANWRDLKSDISRG